MAEDLPNLPRPPVVEAVLDIECDFAPGAAVESFEAPARTAYGGNYPNLTPVYFGEVSVELVVNQIPGAAAKQYTEALQFTTADGRQVVQVRRGGFSFNRLAPYTSLDDYLPEIEKRWRSYIGFATPLRVKRLRLRFLNRIDLPIASTDQLGDYMLVGPKLPPAGGVATRGFLLAIQGVDQHSGFQIDSTFAGQELADKKLPLTFDNVVACECESDPSDWPKLAEQIAVLREVKNRIFRESFTPKCLQLFQ